MGKASTDPLLDVTAYNERTEELVASMEETTALLTQMAENMTKLSDSFENFGETKEQPRTARSESSTASSHC